MGTTPTSEVPPRRSSEFDVTKSRTEIVRRTIPPPTLKSASVIPKILKTKFLVFRCMYQNFLSSVMIHHLLRNQHLRLLFNEVISQNVFFRWYKKLQKLFVNSKEQARKLSKQKNLMISLL